MKVHRFSTEHLLMAPVAEDQHVIVASHHVQELLEDSVLLIPIVRPEGVTSLHTLFDDDHANEVVIGLFWTAFHVEVNMYGTGGELRRPEHINLLVTYREGLEGMVVLVDPRWGSLPSPPGSE
jgi:hypothetical protein